MRNIATAGERATDPPADSARGALRLALDGVSPDSAAQHFEAYRLARTLNDTRWGHVLDALNAAPDGALSVVGDSADGVGQLLRAAGVRSMRHPEWGASVEAAAIVWLGCPRAAATFDSARLLDFMWNGGVLITSDHAAPMLAARGLLTLAGRGSPRRARARRPGAADETLLPAVYMPAGYDRLAPLPQAAGRTLCTDALTDEPLVVLVPLGAGALLHAVPHWYQDDPPCVTALERRPAQHAPAYAGLESSLREVTFGDLQAAETMLGLLLEGIDTALALRSNACSILTQGSGTAEHEHA
jgi:hypothetical protein